MPKNKAKTGEHDDGLDDIGPNHRLNSSGNGINCGQQNEDQQGHDVDSQFGLR